MLKLKLKLDLDEIQSMPNIAKNLDDDTLGMIAKYCHTGYQDDVQSLAEWTRTTDRIVELAKLESKTKDTPWAGAANVKLPMVNSSVIQYAARAYTDMVQNGKVAKGAVIGFDPTGEKVEKAYRVAEYMSYQLLFEDPSWEEDTDKLLNNYPLTGMAFRKTYYDEIKRKPRSETCLYNECIVSRYAQSLEDCRRISHILCMPRNKIMEHSRAGLYRDLDDAELQPIGGSHTDASDTFEVIEQHTFLDLDGDGYEEPYIVVFIEKTQTILRIVARWDSDGIERNEKNQVISIKPVEYFTVYKFLPAPDGGFYGIGLGHLMHGLLETSNTVVNNLIDAGTLSNMQCGIIDKALIIPGGDVLSFTPGEFKRADFQAVGDSVSNHIHTMQFKEPSPTLLQLLGLLNSYCKEISSINDAMTGDMKTQNTPATTALAAVSQGTKVLGSVHRRLYRALQQELDKLYRINRLYLDDETYFTVMDSQLAVARTDFEDQSLDIRPVADPAMSSEVMRMQKAQAMLATIGQPHVNNYEVMKAYYAALGVDNVEQFIQPPDPNAPPPPEMIQLQAQLDMQGKQLELAKEEIFIKKRELALKEAEAASKALLNEKKAEESVAKAVSTIHAMAIEGNRVEIERLAAKADMLAEPEKIKGPEGSTKAGANKPRPEIAAELDLASPTSPVGMEPMIPEEGIEDESGAGIPPMDAE